MSYDDHGPKPDGRLINIIILALKILTFPIELGISPDIGAYI